MRKIYQILSPFVNELREKLAAHYGRDLIAAIIFGSYARGEVSFSSDLDILIVLRQCELTRRQRQKEFESRIEDRISSQTVLPISPIIISLNEAQNFHPIYLDILNHNIVLAGQELLDELKKQVDQLFRKGVLEEKSLNGKKYWRIANESKIVERLSF